MVPYRASFCRVQSVDAEDARMSHQRAGCRAHEAQYRGIARRQTERACEPRARSAPEGEADAREPRAHAMTGARPQDG